MPLIVFLKHGGADAAAGRGICPEKIVNQRESPELSYFRTRDKQGETSAKK